MGPELGKELARTDGSEVGINDGRDVGSIELGANVGTLLGTELGTLDGTAVGRDVGTPEGAYTFGIVDSFRNFSAFSSIFFLRFLWLFVVSAGELSDLSSVLRLNN